MFLFYYLQDKQADGGYSHSIRGGNEERLSSAVQYAGWDAFSHVSPTWR